MSAPYDSQHRGNDDAYDRYLRGMDQSMRQKVALTAAFLLGEGRVADMGMGSGSGTFALASLYPRVQVTGVDVNPEMVMRARRRHRLPNLEFVPGDIAELVFQPGSLSAIFDSSVLHHVTSFSGYDHEAAARALTNQVKQLAIGGTLIVRDFVAPREGDVWLDLPSDDGDEGDDPRTCSTAALFERFAGEFRRLHADPGFAYAPVDHESPATLREGFRRFRLDRRLAAEFLLRKDYRADWESEVLEEYTYFTQARFESELARLGLRLLASLPIRNPWIVKNRFENRCALWNLDGCREPFPATNHLLVGERVLDDEGVIFEPRTEAAPRTNFLIEHCFAFRDGGGLRDLVRRPGTAVDVVPWFEDRGALYVLARKSHPRPVLRASVEAVSLDGAAAVGYVTEPILVLQSDRPVALTVEMALEETAGIAPAGVISLEEVTTYYPSPGGLVEEVRAVHVEVPPTYVQRDVGNSTGFSTGGIVRAIDARQVLRAAQVGALPDVRLELNVYELFRHQNVPLGPWIGATIPRPPPSNPTPTPFADLVEPIRRAFIPAPPGVTAGFLRVECRVFSERNRIDDPLHEEPREYVVPHALSCNTLSTVLLSRRDDQILIGFDDDDLAAAQCFTGSSALWVTPAWRLPRDVSDLVQAREFGARAIREAYGVEPLQWDELGGRYHPSPGVTPEIVHPYAVAVEVTAKLQGDRRLTWVSLAEVIAGIGRIRDGHLRIGALRAAHALGVFGQSAPSYSRAAGTS